MTPTRYRILVMGSCDWDDSQELRFALIRASVPHLPFIVVIHGTGPSGADALAAEWASDYGVLTRGHAADWPATVAQGADICLAFIRGASPEDARRADMARQAGIPVQRYLRAEAA